MPVLVMAAELGLPPTVRCPSAAQLEEIERAFTAAVVLPPGLSPTSFTVCGMRPSRSANVISVGMWVDAGATTENELAADLAAHELLTPNSTVGLVATGEGVRTIAEAQYRTVDKDQGRVRLDDGIQISLDAGGMTAVVTGALDIPGPNPNFTLTLTQQMTLAPPGSDPPINVNNSQDVSASIAAKLVIAAIAGLATGSLGWLGGAVAFFAVDPVASSSAPSVSLASLSWPSKILTPIDSALRGKLNLTWTELIISEAGILTLGVFDNVARSPSVSIRGPRSVTVLQANPFERATFSAVVDDLRAPLSVVWTGIAGPGAVSDGLVRRLVFTSAGTANIGVDVNDVDQLTASDNITVKITLKRLEDGQQPF